jgi:hypothetical protein
MPTRIFLSFSISPPPCTSSPASSPRGPCKTILQYAQTISYDCKSKPFRFYCIYFTFLFFAPDSRFMIHNSTTLHFISISRHKICCFVLLFRFSFIFCLSFLSEPVSNTLLCYTTEWFISAWRVLSYVAVYGGLQLCRVATNVNMHSRTADKLWFFSLGLGRQLTIFRRKKVSRFEALQRPRT